MADTTSDNVKLIAPELATFIGDNGNLVTLILSDVAGQVDSATYRSKQEQAQRYLAAHLLTISEQGSSGASSGAGGPLKREKVGQLEKEYATGSTSGVTGVSRLDETKYGRIFVDIRKGCVLGFQAVAP